MQLNDRMIVVTGGGAGIGKALCRRFVQEGAAGVVVADRDETVAINAAKELGERCIGMVCDVGNEADIQRLAATAIHRLGRIDLFCSNAGIAIEGSADVPDSEWQRIWQTNVMAHVWAARAVLPAMLARGEGYLLQTASAAGLLTQIGSAPYSVTKHAAVAFAEWLAIAHHKAGIRVSCLCPQGVRTQMLEEAGGGIGRHLRASAIDVDQVADAVVAGIAEERFLILPHPEVADYFRHKAEDYERWLRGMRRLQDKLGVEP